MFEKEMYNKKFSIGHADASDNNIWIECFKNSSPQFKNEIHDIYFSHGTFVYGREIYGNVMGVEASDTQYKGLLKIQEKYGIPISITFNDVYRSINLIEVGAIKAFINHLKKYYKDGVRSCTISHIHLMRTGALQEAFPDMEWKNTVNHEVRSTQEFIDFAKLGYTTVQLDRSLNRDLNELKLIKKEAERLGVRTCLLIAENCMPKCPFKVEHDMCQRWMKKETGESYWDNIDITCNRWRTVNYNNKNGSLKEIDSGIKNPRTGTDIICHDSKDWKELASLVDVFKRSGRLSENDNDVKQKFFYAFEMYKTITDSRGNIPFPPTNLFLSEDFKTIYENNLTPITMWFDITIIKKNYPFIIDLEEIRKISSAHFWNTPEAVELSKILKTCKNQCYRCHKCDEVFKTGKLDSVLEL